MRQFLAEKKYKVIYVLTDPLEIKFYDYQRNVKGKN
jgi:hypothetical protein